ncbi:MAG TPA: BON domain-containing protein [Thermoanaerobaculia bacterium]|nr:BON domain-containing protein [Thermoanaerobaculia bacterium]
MKLRNLLVLLVLLALATALVAGPALAADALDTVVQQKLVDKLGDDAKTIKVAVVDKKVVLVGEVKGRDTQELATEVAKSVPGVTSVDNQVKAKAEKVISVGKVGDEAADQKLEMAVENLLKKELGDHAKDLEVENVGGTVSVRGTVPDDARLKIARDAVKSVPGVKKVVDLLEVAKK